MSRLRWQRRALPVEDGARARQESALVADDEEGCEWIVMAHDGGTDGTFNWTRSDPRDPVNGMLAMGTDFPTMEAAREAADKHAAEVLE